MPTVFIWNNNQITFKLSQKFGYTPAAKDVIGHTSMNIHDNFGTLCSERFDMLNDNSESYVSWWPVGSVANKKQGESIAGSGTTLLSDIMTETYVPDHIIRIETPPPACIQRMEQEWSRQLEKEGKEGSYHFLKENCSRVVSRVLRRGFNKGRGNIKYGQLASGVWTPLMVKRLALDLKGGPRLDVPARQMLWEDFVDELVEHAVIYPKTGSLLKLLKRRASNRGSSGATARFDYSKAERLLDRFRKSQMNRFRSDRNLPLALIAYAEARSQGHSIKDAGPVCMNWMKQERSEEEIQAAIDNGQLKEMFRMIEHLPTPPPKKPPRRKKKATA